MDFMGNIVLGLLGGDSEWVGGLVGGLGAVIAAIAVAAAAKKKKLQRRQAQAARRDILAGAGAVHKGKEKDMAFVPIMTGGGGRPASDQTASGHIHPVAIFWFVVWLLIAVAVFIPAMIVGDNTNQDSVIIA